MIRNKMTNLRGEEDCQDNLRIWSKANYIEVATHLYQVLYNLVDDRLTVEQLARLIDEDKLSELEEKSTKKIHKTIDKKLPSVESDHLTNWKVELC